MTNPKGEKPESDHPHEDELPLELHQDPPAAGEENPLDALGLSASIEEFHFSGPAEELDFTEPTDFTFPQVQPAEAEQLFGFMEGTPAVSPLPEEAAVEAELAGEGIADLEIAEEAPEEEEKPKPKFELPRWARIAEWITVGLLAASALLAIASSIAWVKDPVRVKLTFNIACSVMLGLIPYTLWRSRTLWQAYSATYTIIPALGVAVLIVGTWFEGQELSRYQWQFTKARVNDGKKPSVVSPPAEPAAAEKTESAKDPAAK